MLENPRVSSNFTFFKIARRAPTEPAPNREPRIKNGSLLPLSISVPFSGTSTLYLSLRETVPLSKLNVG